MITPQANGTREQMHQTVGHIYIYIYILWVMLHKNPPKNENGAQ